jgi:anaerobic selenocysteine-containing dehydrogenase
MHMYHSWGSHNAWLRQIQTTNPIFIARALGRDLGLGDDDWVWIESPHGRVKARVKLMEGVERHTIWTWNAIGKRAGAWNLDANAPEARTGFLLNQVISELLPARSDGYRYANIDPVTGQAAWYDLKVRLVKCSDADLATTDDGPQPLRPALDRPPGRLAYGAEFKRARTKT